MEAIEPGTRKAQTRKDAEAARDQLAARLESIKLIEEFDMDEDDSPTWPPAVGLWRDRRRLSWSGKVWRVVVLVERAAYGKELDHHFFESEEQVGGRPDLLRVGPVRALEWSPDARARPLEAGVSLGPLEGSAGTLGGFDRDDRGQWYAVTAGHVFDGASEGDPALQPAGADGGGAEDAIGHLRAVARVHKRRDDRADVAVVALTEPMDSQVRLTAAANPEPEDVVSKVGRTSGHTTGRVAIVGITNLGVRYTSPPYRRYLNDLFAVEGDGRSFSVGGDSGALVRRGESTVGMVVAASSELTFATDMPKVATTVADLLAEHPPKG